MLGTEEKERRKDRKGEEKDIQWKEQGKQGKGNEKEWVFKAKKGEKRRRKRSRKRNRYNKGKSVN